MINVFKPSLGDEEVKAVSEVLRSGWIGLGPKVTEFEKQFATYIGIKYALAMNSATGALHLALHVLDIKDKEVITTPMTFVATNHAILYNGGIPVFTDIEEDTLNIDTDKIEKNITPNTKAIVVVHYGGHACDMDKVLAIAKKNNLFVVEDCAHAAGGEYKGKKLGTFGNMACFSFHGVKNMTTGDGGMLVTNNKEFYDKIKKLRWVGMDKDTFDRNTENNYARYYDVDCLGYKYHMNDIAAAIGIEQLKKLDKMNKRRREITNRYNKELSKVERLKIPVMKEYANSNNHNYVIKTKFRNELNKYLAESNISTGVHYIPTNHYNMYKSYGNPTPISDNVWEMLLTLPLYPDLTDEEVGFVIEKIKNFKK